MITLNLKKMNLSLRANDFLQFTPSWPSTPTRYLLRRIGCYSQILSSPSCFSSDHLRTKSRRHPGAVIPSWVFTKVLPAFAAVSFYTLSYSYWHTPSFQLLESTCSSLQIFLIIDKYMHHKIRFHPPTSSYSLGWWDEVAISM